MRLILGVLTFLALAGFVVVALGQASKEVVASVPGEPDAQGSADWIRQFGTSHTDGAEGVDIDADGNLYVAGYTWDGQKDADGPTGYDAVLTKFSPDGQEIWVRNFGTPNSDYAWGVAVGSGGTVYVFGHTRGALPGQSNLGREDLYLRKFDADGNELWTRQFGTEFRDQHADVAVDGQDNVYVAGIARTALPGQTKIGNEDAYIRKYSPDGDEVWTRQFGTKGTDLISAITLDGDGNLYAVGPTSGTFQGETWVGEYDGYLAKFDVDGNHAWTRQFGTEDKDTAVDVTADSNGRVYVAGFLRIALPGQRVGVVQNALAFSFDSDGNRVWRREFGTMDEDFATHVAVDAAGDVYVVGRTDGAMPGQVSFGGDDAYVRKYTPGGDEVWTYQFGSASGDNVRGIVLDGNGNLFAVGRTNGVFPGQEAQGLADSFLVKLSTGFVPPADPGPAAQETGSCSVVFSQVMDRYNAGWMLIGLMLVGLAASRIRR